MYGTLAADVLPILLLYSHVLVEQTDVNRDASRQLTTSSQELTQQANRLQVRVEGPTQTVLLHGGTVAHGSHGEVEGGTSQTLLHVGALPPHLLPLLRDESSSDAEDQVGQGLDDFVEAARLPGEQEVLHVGVGHVAQGTPLVVVDGVAEELLGLLSQLGRGDDGGKFARESAVPGEPAGDVLEEVGHDAFSSGGCWEGNLVEAGVSPQGLGVSRDF